MWLFAWGSEGELLCRPRRLLQLVVEWLGPEIGPRRSNSIIGLVSGAGGAVKNLGPSLQSCREPKRSEIRSPKILDGISRWLGKVPRPTCFGVAQVSGPRHFVASRSSRRKKHSGVSLRGGSRFFFFFSRGSPVVHRAPASLVCFVSPGVVPRGVVPWGFGSSTGHSVTWDGHPRDGGSWGCEAVSSCPPRVSSAPSPGVAVVRLPGSMS